MKKLHTVAAIALAAALGTATLAACSGKNLGAEKFNLSDYAHPLDSVYAKEHLADYADTAYVNDAYTTLTQKNFSDLSVVGSVNGASFAFAEVAAGNSAITYTFYDVKNDKELFTGLYMCSVNTVRNYGHYNDIYFYSLVKKVELPEWTLPEYPTRQEYKIQYAGPDGQLLTGEEFTTTHLISSMSEFVWMSYEKSFQDKDGAWFDFFSVYYHSEKFGTAVERYFCYYEDDDGFTWKEVSEDYVEGLEEESGTGSDSDHKAGTQLGLPREKISVNNEDYPVNNYKGIEYTVEGGPTKTYTFYKNDSELSSISVANGEILGYVGDYVYYTQTEYVSATATKGYNLEINSGEGDVVKANVKLYRYNFVKDKSLKEISMDDYVILSGQALYNYSSNKVDALIAAAYKTVDGVAVVNAQPSMVVLNEKGKVIADLSGTEIYNLRNVEIYKLSGNRYLAGSYILDSRCKVVAQLPYGATVWAEKSLIKCNNNMFLDYNGKIVVEPSVGILHFYGDAAYSTYDNKIHTIYDPSGVDLNEIISVDEERGETVYVYEGVIVKRSIVGQIAYTYTLYDLSGKQLGSTIEYATSASLSFSKMGEMLIAKVTVLTNPSASAETKQVLLMIR